MIGLEGHTPVKARWCPSCRDEAIKRDGQPINWFWGVGYMANDTVKSILVEIAIAFATVSPQRDGCCPREGASCKKSVDTGCRRVYTQLFQER